MSTLPVADDFFDDVDYVSIISTIKGIYTSNGSMSVLLDFERVLDEADIYAFRNWQLGELVQGPVVKRYSIGCMFMWPYKLMPDPSGAKRLVKLGCKIQWKKTKIEVPVEVENPDDFVCATGVSHSVRELVNYVFTRLGLNWSEYVKQDEKFLRPEELHDLKGDSSKLVKSTGWVHEYSFETMLDEMISYWLKELNRVF